MARNPVLLKWVWMSPFPVFLVAYLTTVSVSGLYSVDGKMINARGGTSGLRIATGNRSTHRKPTLLPLLPPQIPHDVICDVTEATAE